MDIKAVTAVVTGGASGLGAAVARHLVAAGARVGIVDLNAEKGAAAAQDMGCAFAACDVADAQSGAAAIAALEAEQGVANLLVNCAGIATPGRIVGREGPLDLASFESVIRVNLIGTFNMMRLAADAMSRLEPNADGERGVIVSTASIAAYEAQVGQAAYGASKGGVAAMTIPAARELARFGIRVMSIAPGIFETPLLEVLPEDIREELGQSHPFPARLGRPPEFAALVQHIVENPFLNGETIRIDGAIRLPPK